MDVSVCVLTHNQPELLPLCVASCFAELERSAIVGEVIIIDNASADGNPQGLARQFPGVRIVRNEENLGFAAGNNQAIRVSRGRYILLLNDDAVLLEGSLRLMVQELVADSGVGAVGPRLLNVDGTPQRNFTHRRFPHLRGILCQLLRLEPWLERRSVTRDLFTLSKDLERRGEADHLAAACLVLRREAIEGIGLFDENFYYWYEDVDLCFRLKQGGWRIIYLPLARVTHYASASLRKLSWLEANNLAFRSMLRFFRKHSGPVKYRLVRLTLALFIVLRLPALVLYRIWKYGSLRESWNISVLGTWSLVRILLGSK